MNRLNVSALGVEEMTRNSMVNTNGGVSFVVGILAGLIISEIFDRNSRNDYNNGWEDAKNGKFKPRN